MPFKHLVLLICLAVFTRVYKLDWANGFFFHPDEANMGRAVIQLSPANLNPNFYAYGQFPLYATYILGQVYNLASTGQLTPRLEFAQSIIILRIISAVFSLFSVLIFYKIGKILFKKPHLIFGSTLVFIFTPGLIQLAHFGTTESILIFVFLGQIYLALLLCQKPRPGLLVLASFLAGFGLATKITAVFFTVPVYLSLFIKYFLKNKKALFITLSLFFLTASFLTSFIFSPYNFLDFSQFISSIKYETEVATGQAHVFYTRQFITAPAYLFQLLKVFPYASGLFVYIASLFVLLTLFWRIDKKQRINWFLILLPSLIYFLYVGQLYTKWSRFVSPLFVLFPLLFTLFLTKFSKRIFPVLVFVSIIPGLYFMRLYFFEDIRQIASKWLLENIPVSATVLSEAGNVLNIPLTDHQFNVINFDFYNYDSSPGLQSELPSILEKAEYVLVPSRRMFKNQNSFRFPSSQKYYQNLFSGRLGFNQIKEFKINPNLLLDSEQAEETWSVFDHPTIRLYRKTTPYSLDYYQKLLLP